MAGMDELLAVGWRRRTMDSHKVAGNSLMAWALGSRWPATHRVTANWWTLVF